MLCPDPSLSQMFKRCFDVDRAPEHDHVDVKSEGSKLILLPFAITLAQFGALIVKDGPTQAVPSFAAVNFPSVLRRLV